MKSLLTLFRYLIFLAAGAALLWFTFRHQNFNDVFDKIIKADPFWVGITLIISILALISRAMRWKQLIVSLGYNPRLSSTFKALMLGYLANMALPRLGEVSRCGALNKSDEIPFDKLLGTVIVERVSDVIMLLLCMLLVAFLEFERLGGFMNENLVKPMLEKWYGNTVAVVVIIVLLITGVVIIFRLFKMQNPPAWIQKIKKLLSGIGEGLQSITHLENKGVFLFHTFFIWGMYLLLTYVSFFAFPFSSGLTLSAALFITVLGGIGMSAPVQGGIGTYDWLVSQGLILYGLSETNGTVFAVMGHSVQTLFLVALGIISMISLFFFTKKQSSSIHESSANAAK